MALSVTFQTSPVDLAGPLSTYRRRPHQNSVQVAPSHGADSERHALLAGWGPLRMAPVQADQAQHVTL